MRFAFGIVSIWCCVPMKNEVPQLMSGIEAATFCGFHSVQKHKGPRLVPKRISVDFNAIFHEGEETNSS